MTCKTWGKAPSDYFPELSEYEAFCLDEAAALLVNEKEREEIEKQREQLKNQVPGGRTIKRQPQNLQSLLSQKFRVQAGTGR